MRLRELFRLFRLFRAPSIWDDYDGPDANLWCGVYRGPAGAPTLVVTLRPCYWSLPFSWATYGCLLGKPGFTFGFLCVYVAWSRL